MDSDKNELFAGSQTFVISVLIVSGASIEAQVLRGSKMRDCVSVRVPLMDYVAVLLITKTQAR